MAGESTSSTAAAGTTLDSASMGGEVSGSTAPLPPGACEDDLYELNNQEGAATPLPNTDITSPAMNWNASLETADAEDWYQVHGTADGAEAIARPTVTVSPTTVDMCAFVICDSGAAGTNVDCDGMATNDTSPVQGLDGCCHTGDGIVPIQFDCASPAATGTVFIRVSGPPELTGGVCDYSLEFDYSA